MKKALLLSVLFILILMMNFALAVIPAPTHNWTFDAIQAYNDTGSSPLTATPDTKTYIKNSGCVKNECAAFSDGTVALSGAFANVGADFTVSCFVNFNVSTDMLVYIETEGTGSKGFGWYHQATTNKECAFAPGVASSCTSAANPLNAWQMVTIVYDQDNAGDRYQIYFNKTLQTDSGNQQLVSDTYTKIYLSDGGLFPWQVNGYLDECLVWNTGLTYAQVNETYDSIFAAPAAPPTASITLNTNLVSYGNYSSIPLVISFNGTAAYTSDAGFNCTLTQNLATYAYSTSKANLNLSVNQNFTINTTDTSIFDGSGLWTANVSCSNNNATGSFKKDNIFIDVLSPSITPLGYTNNSIYWRNIDRTINLTTKYTDLNLFAANLTLVRLNPDGSRNLTLFNFFTQNMTGSSKTNFIANYTHDYTDNSSFTSGKYLVKVTAWDSHTAQAIAAYPQKEILNGKEIAGVKISSPEISSFTTTKEIDKYTFEMAFKADNPKVFVECTNPQIIKDSGYKGHIVCFEENKWIDFEEYAVAPILTKTDARTIQVTLQNVKAGALMQFESIGDLNVNDMSYYFNISDSFIFRANDHFTAAPISNFTIAISNGATIQQKTASGTNVSFNITAGNYVVNITQSSYAYNVTNVTFSSGGNFTWDLFAANSLYVFIYDELTDSLLSNRTIVISVINYDNSTVNTTTQTGWVFLSGFSTGDYEIRYAPENYTQRSYYTTITSSSTQQIELYSLATSVGTYTNFIIEDETGNLIEGAKLKAYRHFPDCNCFKVIEMDLSNFNGVATLFLQHYDGKYRFIVDRNGLTLYSSTAQEGYRITESSYTLTVTTLGDTYQSFYGTAGLWSNLSYSNTTKLFYYTVNDASSLVNQFCLYVDQMNPLSVNGTDRVCLTCLNASTGTVTCNVSNYLANKRQFVAKGWIHTNTTYSYYWDKIITWIEDRTAIDTLGKSGIFMGLFLTLTVTMAGVVLVGIYGGIIGILLGLGISMAVGLIAIDIVTFLGIVALGVILMILIGDGQ